MGIDPADEAGAVEGGLRRGAAPDIREPQIFFRFLDQRRKGRVRQCLSRHLILRTLRRVGVDVPAEQIGLIALELQGSGIPRPFIVRQPLRYHRFQLIVPQCHIENVVFIGFRFTVYAVLICPCNGAVADLRYGAGGKGVLSVEKGL